MLGAGRGTKQSCLPYFRPPIMSYLTIQDQNCTFPAASHLAVRTTLTVGPTVMLLLSNSNCSGMDVSSLAHEARDDQWRPVLSRHREPILNPSLRSLFQLLLVAGNTT
jgi:hypothetical protein